MVVRTDDGGSLAAPVKKVRNNASCVLFQECDPHIADNSSCIPQAKTFPPTRMPPESRVCTQFAHSSCCNSIQLKLLEQKFTIIRMTLGLTCPACARNVEEIFCTAMCSPDQSQFLTAIGQKRVKDPLTGVLNVEVMLANLKIDRMVACNVYKSCAANTFLQTNCSEYLTRFFDAYLQG